MIRTWFISDTHFNHTNIIKYENRPFQSVEEMNQTMIENWNRVVRKDDRVFHLGDVGFGSQEELVKIVQQLNGRKHLVLGNHDRKKFNWFKAGFESFSRFPIILDNFFILSHEPVYLNDSMPYANIHGHIHSRLMTGNYFNVSVEIIGYEPFLFEDIKKSFKSRN